MRFLLLITDKFSFYLNELITSLFTLDKRGNWLKDSGLSRGLIHGRVLTYFKVHRNTGAFRRRETKTGNRMCSVARHSAIKYGFVVKQ